MKFFGSLVEGNGWIGKYYKLGKQIFDLLSLQSIDLKKYPISLTVLREETKRIDFQSFFLNQRFFYIKLKMIKKAFWMNLI